MLKQSPEHLLPRGGPPGSAARRRWRALAAIAAAVPVAAVIMGTMIEYRHLVLAAYTTGQPPPDAALTGALLRAGLYRAGTVLGLAGLAPACILLLGGPRRGTFMLAAAVWAFLTLTILATLWRWSALPA